MAAKVVCNSFRICSIDFDQHQTSAVRICKNSIEIVYLMVPSWQKQGKSPHKEDIREDTLRPEIVRTMK